MLLKKDEGCGIVNHGLAPALGEVSPSADGLSRKIRKDKKIRVLFL
jgi:hypothetical protein